MASMRLRFKKRPDATVAFTCVREDGSWSSAPIGAAEGYGPLHDLAHFVVESTLGLTGGFLGLVARGWDIQDFDTRVLARIGQEPDANDAGTAECLAGLLSGAMFTGSAYSAEELNWSIREVAEKQAPGWVYPTVTDAQFDAMWGQLTSLRARWDALGAGETLDLEFRTGVGR